MAPAERLNSWGKVAIVPSFCLLVAFALLTGTLEYLNKYTIFTIFGFIIVISIFLFIFANVFCDTDILLNCLIA